MRKKLFKVLTFIAVINLPFLTVDTFYANEREKMTFDKMIEKNMDKHTTHINKNIEKKLNAYGLSDDNINEMPESFVKKIEENNGNISVDVKFYGCVEEETENCTNETQEESVSENVEQVMENDDLVELSEEEINMVINNCYSEDNTSNSIVSEVASGFVQTAYAASNEDEKEWDYDGVVEVYICMTYGTPASNGTRTVDVYTQAEWLEEPSKRGEDVLDITFDQDVSFDKDSLKGSYTYQNVDHSNPGILITTDESVSSSKLPMSCKQGAAWIKFNLVDDKSWAKAKKHKITLSATGIVSSSCTTCVQATATYWHKTTSISKDTTVEFSASNEGVGITVYTTLSKETKLKSMPNGAIATLFF